MANKHNKFNFITGVAAFALVLGAGPAFAQYNPQPQGTEKSNPGVYSTDRSANAKTPADDAFAQKAEQGDMAEVKLGQLAEQKGTNPAVRDFGKRMVQDHSKNEKDLTEHGFSRGRGLAVRHRQSRPEYLRSPGQA